MAYYKCGRVYTTQNSNVVVDTASGAIANFETDLALPIKSLEVDVNAVQESGTPTPATPLPISGWSEIKIVHTGKNLLNLDDWIINQGVPMTISNGAITLSNSGYQENNNSYALSKNASYTLSFHFKTIALTDASTSFAVYADGNKVIPEIGGESNGNIRLNSVEQERDVVIKLSSKSKISFGGWAYQGTVKISNIQLELGSTATEYEPYNGTEDIILLGGSYYGGHFTQDKAGHRQFVITHAFYSFDGTENVKPLTSDNRVYIDNLPNVYGPSSSSEKVIISSHYLGSSQSQQTDGTVYKTTGNNAIVFHDNVNGVDKDTFKAFLLAQYQNNTPVTIVYQVATPIIIDLPDGEPIATLIGTNNIYADTGDTSLQFRKIG